MACQSIRNQLAELNAERSALQAELSTAAPGAKSRIVAQIKALNKQIAVKTHDLDVCLMQAGGGAPLNTVFGGTYTLAIAHPAVARPLTGDVTATVSFNATRSSVTVLSLSPLSATFDTPLGRNTTTVTLLNPSVGSFDKTSGQLGVSLGLYFDHSIDLPIYEEDSTLAIALGTGSAGSLQGRPMDAAGQATLVGSAVLAGGYLGGSRADLGFAGRFAALP